MWIEAFTHFIAPRHAMQDFAALDLWESQVGNPEDNRVSVVRPEVGVDIRHRLAWDL